MPPSALALVALLTVAWDPLAPVYVPHGFLTGNAYLERSEAEKFGYLMGLVDGLFGSAMLGADQSTVLRLKSCTADMNNAQIKAIFEKYLKNNPEIWRDDAQVLFWDAMLKACPALRPHPAE